MKKLGLIFLMQLILSSASPAFAKENIWLPLDQGLTEAKQANRFVLVHFYADWCHDCHKMAEAFAQNKAVKTRLKASFIPVRLSQKGQRMVSYQGQLLSEENLVKKLRPPGFPTLMFYTPQGHEIGKIPGYLPPEDLIKLLDFIAEEKYKLMTFYDYKK